MPETVDHSLFYVLPASKRSIFSLIPGGLTNPQLDVIPSGRFVVVIQILIVC